MELVRCNLCNQDHARVRFTKKEKFGITPEEFQVVECQTCGLLYVNPRPSQADMDKYYPEVYSWKETLKGDSWSTRLIRRLEKGYRYHLLKGEVSKVMSVTGKKKGRVLDVGCGTGDRLDAFRQRGFEAFGVETSNSADYASGYLNLKVHKGDLLSAQFPDRFVDIVTLYHVLEHTPNPLEVCREIHRILKDDGFLVIQVPNKESFQQTIFGKRWEGFDLPRHLYYFGVGTLSDLLGKAGFRVLKMDHFMNWIHPPTLVLSLFPGLNPQESWEIEASGGGAILHRVAWGLLTVMSSPVTLLESATKRGAIVTCYAAKENRPNEVKRRSGPISPWRWEGPLAKESYPERVVEHEEDQPAVEILLSTYNGSPFLREQLDSLLNQTYGNWSLIIRDDGSTDDTLEIIRDYRARFPGKITLIEGQGRRLGPCQSYARLLGRTTANYIMFCDQDDLWLPEKIEETLHRMRSLELQYPGLPLLIHTDMTVADRDLRVNSDSFWAYQHLNPELTQLSDLLMLNNVTGCTMMINRELKRRALPVPEGAIIHDWWFALVASGFGKIDHLPASTLIYRQHGGNEMGAVRYSFGYFAGRIRNLGQSAELARRIVKQGQFYFSMHGEGLSKKDYEVAYGFSTLFDRRRIDRLLTLLRFRMKAHGFLRNLGLLSLLTFLDDEDHPPGNREGSTKV